MKRLSAAKRSLGMLAAFVCLIITSTGYGIDESELEQKTDAFLKTSDYENALKLVEDFILENPEKPIGHAMLAKVLAADGQTEKALKAYYQFYKLGNALSGELAFELLLGALNDDSWEVRAYATFVLGKLGDKSAAPHLINVLNHHKGAAQSEAAKALGKLGDKSAVPHLIKILSHDNETAQEEAAKALGKLGDKSAVPHLIKILNHDYYGYRRKQQKRWEN